LLDLLGPGREPRQGEIERRGKEGKKERRRRKKGAKLFSIYLSLLPSEVRRDKKEGEKKPHQFVHLGHGREGKRKKGGGRGYPD